MKEEFPSLKVREIFDNISQYFIQATGSAQQKLKWQFRLYDRDGSGCIDLKGRLTK